MSPRELRDGLKNGEWTAGPRRDPFNTKDFAPPPDWPRWRQDRLVVSMMCARLFLTGKKLEEIRDYLAPLGLFHDKVSKARMAQYVDRGVNHMVETGMFVPVKIRKA